MKLLFLVRSLDLGGAERQLCVLARELKARGCDVTVAVFYAGGPLQAELFESGVPVIDLAKKGRWDLASFVLRLSKTLWRERPDVLHAYLSVPNILAALIKPLFPATRMVWGVRASSMDLTLYDWTFSLVWRIECALSRFADLVICNSRAGLEHAARHGFPRAKMVAIANGIDTTRFRPDAAARRRVREEWGIADDEVLIGLVARLDPVKNHPTFLRAAAMLAKERPEMRFVCVGDGPQPYKGELITQARRLGLDGRLIWTSAGRDMPAVHCALDIASSASSAEGFSNTIAEAMACGVPCVVTDVGDSPWIVGDTGHVVPSANPDALKAAMLELLARSRASATLGERSRARIVSRFGLDALAERTLAELQRVCIHAPGSTACRK